MQLSLIVESTPAYHRREYNVLKQCKHIFCQVQGHQQQSCPEKKPATVFQRNVLCNILKQYMHSAIY